MINKEEINKLNPQERIKKLRQIKRDLKKDVVEIDRIIADSEGQVKATKIAEEVSPQIKAVDISALFETLGGLEGQVQASVPGGDEPQKYAAGQDYSNDYKIKSVLPYAQTSSEPVEQATDTSGEIIDTFKYESDTEKTSTTTVASKAVMYKIKKRASIV